MIGALYMLLRARHSPDLRCIALALTRYGKTLFSLELPEEGGDGISLAYGCAMVRCNASGLTIGLDLRGIGP
jgi:hypothetical protein